MRKSNYLIAKSNNLVLVNPSTKRSYCTIQFNFFVNNQIVGFSTRNAKPFGQKLIEPNRLVGLVVHFEELGVVLVVEQQAQLERLLVELAGKTEERYFVAQKPVALLVEELPWAEQRAQSEQLEQTFVERAQLAETLLALDW